MPQTFLPNKVELPCGGFAKRHPLRPWVFECYPRGRPPWDELKDIPGVLYDGYRRAWLIPEEVLQMEVLNETQSDV